MDRQLAVLRVLGKGGKARSVPYGKRAAIALERYLRLRADHRHARLDDLWLARVKPLGSSGIYQMLIERAKQAGLGHIHPHQFRHSAVHEWLLAGGQETDAKRIFGWSSRQMLQRYGASISPPTIAPSASSCSMSPTASMSRTCRSRRPSPCCSGSTASR